MKKGKKTSLKMGLRILGIGTGSLVALILLAYVVIYLNIRWRIGKTYSIPDETMQVNYDSASLKNGEHLVATRACKECHGQDLGGNILIDDFAIGRFVSKNLTKGQGGLPDDYSVHDWVRAMKHGLNKKNQPLFLMPSHELSQLSEEDLSDIIAYCSRLPNVDREMPPFRIGPLAYVLTAFDLIPLLPAEMTDHSRPLVKAVAAEVSVEYGRYLSAVCINCHGQNFKGGASPVPGGTPVADISSTGNPGKWTHEQFITTLKTGNTPEGKVLKPEEMPWTITRAYTDEELTALHLYLQSVR